jgi:hypothetical protein
MKTLLLFLSLVAAQAWAAGVATDPRTIEILSKEVTRLKPVVATILAQQQRASGGCNTLSALQAKEMWVLNAPLFDLNGKPTAGRWQVRYVATLCGQARERNVLFTAQSGGATAVDSLQPGTTLTNAQLSADVWKSFQAAAAKMVPNCRDMRIQETSVTQAPATRNGLWRELWTARACTQDVAQIITFYPTKQGTVFRMVVPSKSPQP